MVLVVGLIARVWIYGNSLIDYKRCYMVEVIQMKEEEKENKSQAICRDLLIRLKHKEELAVGLAETNKEIARLSAKANETMAEEDCDEVTLEGIKFTPITEENYGLSTPVKGEKWDEYIPWFDWLRENEQGDLIKTKESVHAGTRKSFLNSWQDDGNKLPDFIKTTTFDTIKYNKEGIKRLVKAQAGG